MKKSRTTGTVTNCVISSDANIDGVIVSKRDKMFGIIGKELVPGSKSNYIVADANQIVNIETYLDVNTCDFSISSGNGKSQWKYIDNSTVPVPRAVLRVFDNAVG